MKAHPQAAGQKTIRQDAALGRSKGGLTTKLHAVVDALGNLVHVHLSAGQESDCKYFARMAARLPASVQVVVADKGYDTNAIVAHLAERQIAAVIPAKKNRKQGRVLDENLYEDRNKVERFFLKIKQNRAVATRYDKKAACFLAVIHLAAIMHWLARIAVHTLYSSFRVGVWVGVARFS
ncbi:MAG: IS5 family transposase [Hymenobacteraceae bacterium]|nr:IS5 family transposase [Hymenobacteraceae bacterium]